MLQLVAVPRVRIPPRIGAGRHVDPSLACELERLDYSAWLAVGEALASLTDKVIERGATAAGVRVSARGGRRRQRGAAAYNVVVMVVVVAFWCRRSLRCCCAQSNGCAE